MQKLWKFEENFQDVLKNSIWEIVFKSQIWSERFPFLLSSYTKAVLHKKTLS